MKDHPSEKAFRYRLLIFTTTTGTYAEITGSTGNTEAGSSSPVYEVSFINNGEHGAYGWLDYLQLKARRSNIFSGKTSQFFDSESVADGRITEFTIRQQNK